MSSLPSKLEAKEKLPALWASKAALTPLPLPFVHCGLKEVDPITANNTQDKDDRHILTLRDLFLSSLRASVARLGLGLHGDRHP